MFETLDELWMYILDDILERGTITSSRVGKTRELTGFVAKFSDPHANFIFNPQRKLSPSYAAAELLWYLSSTNDTKMLQAYAPSYEQFTEDGRHAWGAYGARLRDDASFKQELFKVVHEGKLTLDSFFDTKGSRVEKPEFIAPITQLQAIAALLTRFPDSRQAVVALWNAGDLPHAIVRDKKDLPCTLSLQFLLRGKLNLIATMRSNDVWLGFPYDVWCFTGIQMLLAEALGVEVGWYLHQAGSMHLYEKNFEQADKARSTKTFETGSLQYNKHARQMHESIQLALQLEKHNREHKTFAGETINLQRGSLLHECLTMAASRFCRVTFQNSLMEKHCANF